MELSLQALEAAINHWRGQKPAHGVEYVLSPEVSALATVYALMIYHHRPSVETATLDPYVQQLLATHD